MTEPSSHAQDHTHVWDLMVRLGIEPSEGVIPSFGLRYAAAFHTCGTCTCRQACGDWLAHAPETVNVPPGFCPCADILFELRFDRPGLLH